MIIIRKVLTICSLSMAFGFAQEYVVVTDSAAAAQAKQDSIATVAANDSTAVSTDSTATTATTAATAEADSAKPAETVKPADTAKVAAPTKAKADTAAADTAAPKKMRNKITYADYQDKVQRSAKKRSKTMHHGLSLMSATYNDKNYWHMDQDAVWGMGMGMYYFYRHYFGNYLGIQGRIGALYRYSRWTFDVDEQDGKLSTGEKYTLTHELDRKYYNFSADMPLTGKFGYHVKGTTTFLYTSLTLGLTKPIYELTDTENRLYLSTKNKKLKEDIALFESAGVTPFPAYESHQTNKFFYMDDWETNSWIGLGIESRLVSFEVQMFAFGGATQNANHRFYNIGQGTPTWRMFLDFSIR